MAREINYEKIVSSEGFDMKVLGSVCELLNGTGLLEKNISHKKIKGEVVVKNFMDAVQAIPKSEDDNIPDIVVKVFNEFMDVDEDKGFITVTADDLSEKKDEKVENTNVENKKDKKEKKVKPPSKKMKREESMAPAIREGGTFDEIAANANQIYVDDRSEKASNIKQSKVYLKIALAALKGLDLIEESEDIISLKHFSVAE